MRLMLKKQHGGDSTPVIEPNYAYESDESGKHFEIELPGVSEDDLTVHVKGRVLRVTGTRFSMLKATPQQDEEEEAEEEEERAAMYGRDVYGRDAREVGARGGGLGLREEFGAGDEMEPREDEEERTPHLVYELEARLGHSVDVDAVRVVRYADGVLTVFAPMRGSRDSSSRRR